MQATPALNETRLPRQVLQRSAAIAERQRAQAESEAASAAPPAPPAEPSAPAATTADPTPPQPPADPRESDPAYWKQRFKVTEGVLRTEREARTKEALEFNQRITELQDQIRTLQASAPAPDLDMGQFLTPNRSTPWARKKPAPSSRRRSRSHRPRCARSSKRRSSR